MYRDLLDLWNVAPVDILLDELEDISSSWASLRSVLHVWGRIVPGSKTVFFDWLDGSGWLVEVGEGHDVGCRGGQIGRASCRERVF